MQRLKKKFLILSLLVSLCTSLFLVASIHFQQNSITIGCKGYEDEILVELLATLVENKTPYKVRRHTNLGSTFIAFNALVAKDLDLYPEYSGTILFNILNSEKEEFPMEEKLKEKYAIQPILPFGFSNSYVVCVTKLFQQKHNIRTISDLKSLLENVSLRAGMDCEFVARKDYTQLVSKYNLQLNPILMDTGLLYLNLISNELDFIVGNELDDEIKRYDLKILEDDQQSMPSYEALLLINQSTLEKYPELMEVFKLLKQKVTKEEYRMLNSKLRSSNVDIHELSIQYLKQKNLIPI